MDPDQLAISERTELHNGRASFFSWQIAVLMTTSGRRQSKTSVLSTNVDQKSLETEFSIVICHPAGVKWQSKTLFLAIFDPGSSIVIIVFDCRLPDVVTVCVAVRCCFIEQDTRFSLQR